MALVGLRVVVVAVLRREDDAMVRRPAVVVVVLVVLPRKPRTAVVLMVDVRMIVFVCKRDRCRGPVDEENGWADLSIGR